MRKIPSFSEFESLFERLVPRDSKAKAFARWTAVDAQMEAWQVMEVVRLWWCGYFMNRPRDARTAELEEALRAIAKVYEVGLPKESRLYRCVQLPHVEDGEDIARLKHTSTSNKDIQSWSTDQSGAEWFYKTFIIGVNHFGHPEPHKAWVILSTESRNLEVLMHYESAMRFYRDMMDSNPVDVLGFAKDQFDFYNVSEMLKNKEVICKVPNDVPVQIHKVLVRPLADYGRAA